MARNIRTQTGIEEIGAGHLRGAEYCDKEVKSADLNTARVNIITCKFDRNNAQLR